MGIVQLVMGAARIAAGIVPLAPGAVQTAARTTRAAMRTACRDSAAARVMGRLRLAAGFLSVVIGNEAKAEVTACQQQRCCERLRGTSAVRFLLSRCQISGACGNYKDGSRCREERENA